MQLLVEVKGATELANDFTDAARRFPKEQQEAMDTALLLIERDARLNVRQDTRALMGSISSRSKTQGGGHTLIGTVGPSRNYGYWVEFGRRPGKWPPIAAVEGWARRHGISPFLVARAIGRKGTKARPFLIPAFEKNENRIVDLFAKVGTAVVARLGR